MENESNIPTGTETIADAGASSAETLPSDEEYITDFTAPMEDFGDPPREQAAEGAEAKTEGAEAESSIADTDAARPSDDKVEQTDEEKAVDEELKAAPESGRFGMLRKIAARELNRSKSLEAELETARGVMFRPTVPAEDFVAQGKAKEFWDDIAKNHSAYYTPMVQDMLRVELNTERLASGVIPQPVADVLADVFAKSWLPHFLTEQYGIDLPTFQTILERSRSGESATSEVQPTKLSPQEIVDLALDPAIEADRKIIARIEQGNRPAVKPVDPEIAQLRAQYSKLLKAQNGTVKQREEAAATERINAFESLLSADRQGLLDEHLKRIPRDSTGNILKGYEHLPAQIADRVELVLSRNTDYKAKRDHAAKWYKQPGSVETAKSLASGDMKGIYQHHKVVVGQIVAQELAPYADRINAVKALETERRTKQILPGGSSPTHEAEAALRPQVSRRPMTLAERAKQQTV